MLDDYYKIFKAQVDTIDAHGGNAGYHPVVFALHLSALIKKRKMTREAYDAAMADSKMIMQGKAMKSAKEAYLACLFLTMADKERNGGGGGGGSRRPSATTTCWASKITLKIY